MKSRDDYTVFLTNKLTVFANEYNTKRLSEFYQRVYSSVIVPIPKPAVMKSHDKTTKMDGEDTKGKEEVGRG